MNDKEEVFFQFQLLRMVRGEEEALEALYNALAPWVFALIRRILNNPEIAKEVLQDTFLRVYQQAWRYDPMRGKPTTFVFAIARNLALTRLREEGRQPLKDLNLDPHDPEGDRETAWEVQPQDREDKVRLTQALEGLSPPERVLLEEAFYLGLTHRELAERHGLPLGTVKARIRRALLKLKEKLGEA
ncbi:RNA polymerase sigma factor [uncultured Thermus sp.]|uniref:RNA polymerase sigma factor n=1 Tax=uncultured Thermus sp. TaxID=157149 RepID=UPI0026216024|nr:RNA polymerase sigma factor [uncultured Thermus sp.]